MDKYSKLYLAITVKKNHLWTDIIIVKFSIFAALLNCAHAEFAGPIAQLVRAPDS